MKYLFMIWSFLVSLFTLKSQNCPNEGTVFLSAFTSKCNTDPFILAFEDNFDGNSLNTDLWEIQPWGQGSYDDDNSYQYYTLNNVEVSDGTMKIFARQENVLARSISWKPDNEIMRDGRPNLREYSITSSNLWSKKQFGYGKYEIRCKIPEGIGLWPAFWTYGDNPWSEIDVFEFWTQKVLGSPSLSKSNSTVEQSIHSNYPNGEHYGCTKSFTDGTDYTKDFHTFTMIWDRYSVKWYIDGVFTRRQSHYYTTLGQGVNCNGITPYKQYTKNYVFPQREFQNIIVNLAVSTGDKAPISKDIFPASFEIDYIKYYTKNDCGSDKEFYSTEDLYLNEYNNFIGGKNLIFGSDVIIPSGTNLTVVASENITLEPGFTVENGAFFETIINPSLCEEITFRSVEEEIFNIKDDKIDDVDFELSISGKVLEMSINRDHHSESIYAEVYDQLGKKLHFIKLYNGMNKLELNKTGLFFLKVFKENNEVIISNKLIVL